MIKANREQVQIENTFLKFTIIGFFLADVVEGGDGR